MIRDFSLPHCDLNGQTVLVTGGTGSFGKALIRTLSERYRLSRLIVFSRDEMKQHEMMLSPDLRDISCLRFFIGDVRDVTRLELAMRDVDYVLHAAALKHVHLAEYNPLECIHTNVIGAENVILAAIRTGVKKVLALSTDKAANPANLYGASKLAAEKAFIAANALSSRTATRFSVVRYGNVISSRGSVIPFFRNLLSQGATELPITDERMTRFFITLPQSVNFVLSSLELMEGGEVFIPKIPSAKIVEVAEWLAPETPRRVVGVRPGEKLHETLLTETEARTALDLGDRFVLPPYYPWWSGAQCQPFNPRAVAQDFRYDSDSNQEWLDKTGFETLLSQ